ncbi:MAG: efflux RND transporter periplasmic adaptor subunit [bacterium]|nr:efflux RND transporter periplasmic adaptor subunit [bacterium]
MLLLAAGVMLSAACQPPEEEMPARARVPVSSEVLAAAPFQPSLTLLGKVEPAVRLELRAAEGGRVRYPARFASGLRTGEEVARGELLFEIDNDDARLRLAEAELAARLAEAERERAEQGVEGGVLPPVELEQRRIDAELAAERLKSARLRTKRLRVHAPRAGLLLVERAVPPGSELTTRDLRLAELAGEGQPRLEAWAAAADLERLRPALVARCLEPGGGRELGRGTIVEVARQVDRSGTVRLVVEIDQDLGLPLPGEGVEIEVLLEMRESALTLPRQALIIDGGVTTVFVLEPSGTGYKARRRLVQSGSTRDGRIEILDGLKEGERVAVRGAEFLADGLPATEASGQVRQDKGGG